MSVTISIRFLTGRAHLHPWQTHHSEGRVEWPPSHWRLLRALVAVSGRGLTSLPYPDEVPPPKLELKVPIEGMSSLKNRGVPTDAKKRLSLAKSGQTLTLKELPTDAEVDAWKAANPGESFAAAIDRLRDLAAAPEPVAMADVDSDEIPLSRLAHLLHALSATPTIWLPKTSGGHTRQYFPIHDAGMVKNTGSAVFDTFATVGKDQPLCFHWSELQLDEQQKADLKLLLGRMTYFGRAESWCRAEAHTCAIEEIRSDGVDRLVPAQTHWECVCIEDGGIPAGRGYRDYLLERRLAPVANLHAEVGELLPRTKTSEGKNRKPAEAESMKAILQAESPELLLLRCLLRESGQDIKDGLERPIGTRWIHYAVPRAIYDVPRPKPKLRLRVKESVDLVRYALNTATTHRPVLPALIDTLLVADRLRAAVMALRRKPSPALSGHEEDGSPCKDHQHAFWWPVDEDNDGFIDHVIVWAPGGFDQCEIYALRRLTRVRQRGGRPDLFVTPIFVGRSVDYSPWNDSVCRHFVSATPYFCPVHLTHGRARGGSTRPVSRYIVQGLQRQALIDQTGDVSIEEIVFDYDSKQLAATHRALAAAAVKEPVPPRQFFPVIEAPDRYPPLLNAHDLSSNLYLSACIKDPDRGFPFGSNIGLLVNNGARFIRAMSFCRRRRHTAAKGFGRIFRLTFNTPRPSRPFAIGDQCHFGLGIFTPENR